MGLTAKKHIAVALAMICGGAIGNIIDRVRFGAVADFIDVYYKGWHWPAFNLADSCIVLGAGILIVDALFKKEKA
jgi:signal peptidase II